MEPARSDAPLGVVVVSGDGESTSCLDADAAIVFALDIEAHAFERLVEGRQEARGARFRFSTGGLGGRRIAWCVSGSGDAMAAAATQQLIDGHAPRLVITAGFAGGLDPLLPRGSVAIPRLVVTEHDADGIPLDAAGAASPCTIVSVNRVVATAEEKRQLAACTGGQLVDMETHAVARVATAAGLPCRSVRVISDDARETLPPEVARLAAPQSPLRRLGAAVGAIGRRPTAAIDLWKLWEHALADSRTLADAVARGIA